MGTAYQRAKRKSKGLGNWKLVRYADDFLVLVSGGREHAEALRAEVQDVLDPLGLRLAPEKTRVVHIDDAVPVVVVCCWPPIVSRKPPPSGTRRSTKSIMTMFSADSAGSRPPGWSAAG